HVACSWKAVQQKECRSVRATGLPVEDFDAVDGYSPISDLGHLSGLYDATPSWPCMTPSAQRAHPAGDGPPDLVRRIFLKEMEPRDRHLGLRRQAAGEVEVRAVGDEQTGLGLHEQLGYTARRQPLRVGGRDRSHVGGFALDGDLPGPRQ